jgi:hypothetical protein
MPGQKGSGDKPPTPQGRPAARWVKRAAPAPAPPSSKGRRDTIEVNSGWLIPSIPEMAPLKKKSERPPMPPPLPASLAVKPRGNLPPPQPREDDESARADSPKSQKRGERTSKRAPATRRG